MFSTRSSWELKANPLTQAREERQRAGLGVLDLTLSNPTRAGLDYPEEIGEILSRTDCSTYAPQPLGLCPARQAVARYYAARGLAVEAGEVLLTCSTSEGYAFLFKLLADPGDQVLVPQPSYPLFEFLAGLEGIETRPYPLRYRDRWELDLDCLAAALDSRTRAVVLVHPNNPTGSFVKRAEREALEELALERGLALVVDEVFGDYAWEVDEERVGSFAGSGSALKFTLSGLSKVLGLPQLKLSWMAVQGAGAAEALARLEIVADTYLSVGTQVQQALPQLLEYRGVIQGQIRQRVQENHSWLEERLRSARVARLLRSEGGWYGVIEVGRKEEEKLVLELLREEGVLVHPGYFFDFPGEGFVVLSLLVEPPVLHEGVECLLDRLVKG